jgi:predicted nucleic acid-binding protein
MRFLDANIILRHLAKDSPVQSPACFRLIQDIEQGRLTVWTSELVISEVVFVLSSKLGYNVGRTAIRDMLLPLISLPGIRLAHKGIYRHVFDLYTSLPIDYVDAYNAALMESRKETEIYSYDADFDRIQGLTRYEP